MITGIVVGVLGLAGAIAGLIKGKRARKAAKALDLAAKAAGTIGPSIERKRR